MTSVEHLKTIWPGGSSWPEGLTFEQDLVDLGWHQKKFQRRASFAKEWPFAKVAFPGRDIRWGEWRAIPDEKR